MAPVRLQQTDSDRDSGRMTQELEQVQSGQAQPPARVRIRNGADALGVIPFLLGFHPAESMVLLVIEDGHVQMSSRFDLSLCQDPVQLLERLGTISARFPAAEWLLVAYTCDPHLGDEALTLLELALGPQAVIDSIRADGQRYFSRGCDNPSCCPPEGIPYDLTSSVAAAEAVFAGLPVLRDRAQLAELVAGPDPQFLPTARERAARIRGRWYRRSVRLRVRRVDELLSAGRQAPDLDFDQACELGMLVENVKVRDHAWLTMSRDNALQQVKMWQRVVSTMPPEDAVPALCLLGMAGWLSGNGALQVVCLERGFDLKPSYTMLRILEDINLRAVGPDIWEGIRTGTCDVRD